MQSISLSANPGQTVSLVTQVIDGYGARVDGYVPQVVNVLFPDLSSASGYPQAMTRVSTGLYTHQLSIPSGTSGLGTFIVSVLFTNPSTGGPEWQVFQVTGILPFVNVSVTPL